ncbi:hypothetical protein HNO88_004218 [Novosphingobium chloroacetimidivorans]|uniref:Uncharacterized protein n=1 Tax=Novosphingobium chloroacetimidivorans TaxID=1428314 RepID=A0A7W7NZ57_9SPHN|nr:hypothetical protein [Novosphingobium chloroacetimidivorans]MBB4860872.1 hypothetical protein [Novosphingobium chloroacetimidivorans]
MPAPHAVARESDVRRRQLQMFLELGLESEDNMRPVDVFLVGAAIDPECFMHGLLPFAG